MAAVSGLQQTFETVRQTIAALVSALDALERNFTAETALFGWLRLFFPKLKRPEKASWL